MENITHTLIGVALAKSARPAPALARAAWWSSVLASNLPDLDTFLAPLTGGGRLDYLLHHRGYTHTLVAAIPFAVLSAALGALVARHRPTRREWGRLFALALVATLFHVAADLMNDYGVHPLAPFFNRWFYGDFLYILEPFLLFALLPLAIGEARTPARKGVWFALGFLLLGFAWVGVFLQTAAALALTFWAIAIYLLQRRAGGVRMAWATSLVVVLVFGAGSLSARRLARGQVARAFPAEKILQLMTTPEPGNPLCWRVTVASRNPVGDYRVGTGVASLWPSLVSPSSCFAKVRQQGMAPPATTRFPDDPHFLWVGQFQSSLSTLHSLQRDNCRFAALLHFARAPFWMPAISPNKAGDLRYDDGQGSGFSTIAIDPAQPCPRFVPPWEPPIHE